MVVESSSFFGAQWQRGLGIKFFCFSQGSVVKQAAKHGYVELT